MSGKEEDRDASASPNDGWISDEDQEWFDILQAIEEGRQPDHAVLAKHLRRSKFVVEQPVRDYLADHLEGKTRRRRGRPPSPETIEQIRRDFIVRLVYAQALSAAQKLTIERRSSSTPSEIALVETVRLLAAKKKIHMSASAVKKVVFTKRASRRQHST
jgi:hypothetical protein